MRSDNRYMRLTDEVIKRVQKRDAMLKEYLLSTSPFDSRKLTSQEQIDIFQKLGPQGLLQMEQQVGHDQTNLYIEAMLKLIGTKW